MSLRNTLAYLTSLRIPPRRRVPLSHSLHYFPWVSAAHGSINILAFLAASRVAPAAATALLAVVLPHALAGFGPWRGTMEALRGLKTHPGHGYLPGFRPDLRGLGLIAAITALQWLALLMLTPDWRVRAAFVYPILGMSAHTFTFLRLDAAAPHRGTLIARRRLRAGFLSGALLFLAFLFPAGTALSVLAAGALAAWLAVRLRHPAKPGETRAGFTFQTGAVVGIVTETVVLVGLAVAGLLTH